MVGGARRRGRAAPRVTIRAEELQAAYGGSAGAWAAGPAAIYRRMAEPLVTLCPISLAGASVVDFGAGTGATTAAITAAGAEVVGADLTLDMLRADRDHRPPAANADATRMPFRAASFDAAMGAFVLSHIPTPVDALAEAARVVCPGGAVMTVGFDGRWEFAAKETIERVMGDFGFRRPEWYDRFKRDVEPLTAFPDRLAAVAGAAGLAEVDVLECAVDVGVRDADGIVAWRLGTPMYAPFMASLDVERRLQVLDALRAAVGLEPEPLVPALLVLSARVAPAER
jgi:SAM-dependent methyltransferase